MKVNPSIFREYDIRGIAGEKFTKKALNEYERWYGKFPGITITPSVARAIGKAYGSRIRKRGGKEVIVGHEVRPFGKELSDYFIQGVRSTGCTVFDAGVCLTPMIYFAVAFYGLDGGVNVAGSHNVYFFNGFKTMAKDVYPIYGREIQEMRKAVEKDSFVTDKKGKYMEKNIFEDYKRYLLRHNKLRRKIKVIIDSGNGSAGVFAPDLFRELGCEVHELYSSPDARFPHHVPDPEDPWVMKKLAKRVVDEKADLGIALDADGDRFGLIDENGRFVVADEILLFFAKDALSRNKGKKILYDIKCSYLMDELIPKFGGIPLMHVTGHAPIKQSLREDQNIIFGGEISGHFYWVENYFKIDDGIYSAVRFLALLSETNSKVSSLFSFVPKTIMTPEIKLPCEDNAKFTIVDRLTNFFSSKYKTVTIDGARIIFSKSSWGLVRASNTSPYLTLRIEGNSAKDVINIKNIMQDELDKYPVITDKLDRSTVTTHSGRLGWV